MPSSLEPLSSVHISLHVQVARNDFNCATTIFFLSSRLKFSQKIWNVFPEPRSSSDRALASCFDHTVKLLFNSPALLYFNPCRTTDGKKREMLKGEVRSIIDRNICERRSCMKNNGKSPTFKFVSGEERRPSEVQRVSRAGASLAPRTRQRISLGSENDWKFRLRSCQSWKSSSLSLEVVVLT